MSPIGFRHPGQATETWSVVTGKKREIHQLHLAAGDGNFSEVRRLLGEGADPNLRERVFGRTALHWAAISASGTTVDALISAGARIDERDAGGSTPLRAALQSNCRVTPAMMALLDAGADVEAEQKVGGWRSTALLDAVLSPHVDGWKAITLLRRFGARADLIVGEENNQSILQIAVTCAAKEQRNMIALALLQPIEGATTFADVNLPDSKGQTPLHWAARGETNLAATLINFGADVNASDVLGRTPLHMAVVNGSDVVARVLIEHGANAKKRDANGQTPLDFARIKEGVYLIHLLGGD